jgi:acetolactate synthase I/II/III large subunit
MKQSIRLADYVANRVAAEGVECVFLVPGGGAMHLNDAFGSHKSIQYVANHHEQASAIAAEAYSRIHGHLGCALVTTGPGATNAVTPCAGAWIESVPLLILSGQVKRSDLMGDSGVRQRGPQEVDIVSIVRPITKYAVTVTDPLDIRRVLDEAIHLATSGRRGPVWIDVPLDVQNATIVPDDLPAYTGQVADSSSFALQDVHEAMAALVSARRPLILAGHGVRLAGAAAAFRRLVESLQIPVVTTWNASDLIPFDHPLNVGKPGVVALRAPNFAVQNADVILTLGARLDAVVTAHNLENFGRAAKKIVVDVDANELQKFKGVSGYAKLIRADASGFIDALLAQAGRSEGVDRAGWLAQCDAWKRRFPAAHGSPADCAGPISHDDITHALSNSLPNDCLIVTGSSGLAIESFYMGFRNKEGQRLFLTSGLGAMGYALPSAIGAHMASDGRPIVCIESDGSLMMNVQELQTLATLQAPVRLFVLNNNGYASIRNTQRNYFGGRYVGSGPNAGLEMPDLEDLARAFGWEFMRIDDRADLERKIGDALGKRGPVLVDIQLVSDEALAPKCAAIALPDGSMRSMPLEDMSPLLSLEELQRNMIVPLDPVSVNVRLREG